MTMTMASAGWLMLSVHGSPESSEEVHDRSLDRSQVIVSEEKTQSLEGVTED